MNLTPEQRKRGKENFHAAVGVTRRDFLKQATAAGVVSGAGLGAMYFGYEKTLAKPVRVGIIGTGDEGNVLIGALNPEFIEVAAIADIRPYSIHRAFHGDWSSDNTIRVRPGLMKKYGWSSEGEARKHVKVYTNGYEEMLSDRDLDIEGVIIALPLHLHDQAAIRAMTSGKHVLTEKLMAHSVRQCKEMARASEATDMILATGHQRHYSVLYDNAVDMIRRGLLGDIHYIRAQWHRDNLPGRDSWQPPLPSPVGYTEDDFKRDLKALKEKAGDAAGKKALAQFVDTYKIMNELVSWRGKLASVKGKEIDAWQKKVAMKEAQLRDAAVDAATFGYEEITLQDGKGTKRSALEELIRWRLWNRTGGGLMAELGSHQLDASGIFISSQRDDGHKMLPLSVSAIGGRHVFPADRDCDDHVYCIFEYPGRGYFKDFKSEEVADENKKIVVTYSSVNGNGWGGYGETVMGTKGTLLLEQEKEVLLFAGSDTASSVTVKKTSDGPVLDTTESGPPPEAALGKAATSGEVSRGYTEEIEHWAWCIRNKSPEHKPRCHPEVALADAVIALTSNIAMRDKRHVKFEREWFDIHSDATPEGAAPRKMSEIAKK